MITRRQFIAVGAGSAGALATASGLGSNWWGLDGNPVADPETEGDRVVPTFCELCFWKCGVLAHLKDGKVTKITGNPSHPLSRGKLCPRGTGGIGLLYDPDRLKRPLVRVQQRGEEVFEAVSWEAALDRVAEGLQQIRQKHGPEALALFTHGYGGSWFTHLVKAYGSPNIGAPSYAQCRGPREVAFSLTFGQGLGSPETVDIANARCLTLIGSHLGENMHNTQVQDMAEAISRGAELVVVDPRYSTAAGKARYWLPIKPGTDLALLLSWMNVIVGESLFDAPYVAKHAAGFDELKAHVADKTPEWAYPHTGIRPELIRETARFIAAFKPSSLVHPGRRTTWYGDDTQRIRAVAILSALLGSWGRRGGYILPPTLEVPKFPHPPYAHQPRPPVDKPKGPARYPFSDELLASGLCEASIPGTAAYDIKGWMVYGTNLLQSLPDSRQTTRAMKGLDFIVAIDVLPTEITGWADVVLPESTYLERCDDLWSPAYQEPFVALRQPVVPPMYDSKPGWWIAAEIARRLGLKDYFPWKDSTEFARQRVKAAGLDFEALQKTGVLLGKPGPVCEEDGLILSFDTPSKKIELASPALKNAGFHALPEYTPPDEPPPGMFRLLFGRAPVHTFGRTTNNRFLSQCFPENEVWVNTTAAAAMPGFEDRTLRSGDRVMLVNQDGTRSGPVRVKVTERIRGDCVYLVHGYGHTARGLHFARGRGASDSQLVTRFKVDPIMGGTGMNVNFVRLERAPAEARPA
jgi:thiosulfate reductase/polysulfide reductase chain A